MKSSNLHSSLHIFNPFLAMVFIEVIFFNCLKMSTKILVALIFIGEKNRNLLSVHCVPATVLRAFCDCSLLTRPL